ncbi:helix-turn-helix transcriptional regulator [bacterium]|nr:helix-turn-helix transcriptional regulator [bacterium]
MGENYVSTIAGLRKAKGLTQRQVAEALDVDVSSVRNWERVVMGSRCSFGSRSFASCLSVRLKTFMRKNAGVMRDDRSTRPN